MQRMRNRGAPLRLAAAVVVLACSFGGCGRETFEGSFEIRNAEDVAYLRPYREVSGNLKIIASGVTSIELPNLVVVGGSLEIFDNDRLEGLDGLRNVAAIGGNLGLSGNEGLVSLRGLDGLTSVPGYVAITEHARLVSLEELAGINTIGRSLVVEANNVLATLGLASLDSLGGPTFQIGNNPLLATCAADELLSQLAGFAGDVVVQNNRADTCR